MYLAALNQIANRDAAADERGTAGQFALEVMHEIANPLDSLGNLAFLTRNEADQPEKVREYMRLAEEQIANLNRIARQALSFARISEAPKSIDLVDLAEAALRIYQRTIASKRIHLVKDLPADLIAEVQSGQILQVVSNLLANALEALPEAGSLSIRLRKYSEGVHILIADNGHGIEAKHFAKIFEPYFTTRSNTGNGIGLALSKRIVESHGGRIHLRSSVRAGRSGTAFKIVLPA